MAPLPAKKKWYHKGKGKILYSYSFRMKYKKADIGKKISLFVHVVVTSNIWLTVTLDDESEMIGRIVVKHCQDNELLKQTINYK